MQSFKEFVATDRAFASLLPRSGQQRGASLGPVNPYAENDPLAKPNIISIQNVRAGRIFDARCLEMQSQEARKKAVAAMLAAVRSVLTDENAKVETTGDDRQDFGPATTWGKLYPNVDPFENGIRLEYRRTATQNIAGRGLWSLKDIGRRPFQVTGEKLGLRTSPEDFYKKQFENELQDLANQGILLGWPQNWKITTTTAARDIKLLLKEPEII